MSSKPTTLTSAGIGRPRSRSGADRADRDRVAHREDAVGRRPSAQARSNAAAPPAIRRRADDDVARRGTSTPAVGERRPVAAQPARHDVVGAARRVRARSIAMTRTSRWPSSSRCSAAARAPPSSSTSTEATCSNGSESTSTIGRPARRIWAISGWSRGQTDGDDAVDCRPIDRPRQRAVERRDEVEPVAGLLGDRRDPRAEHPEERVGEDRRQGLRREQADRPGPPLGEHPRDRDPADSRARRRLDDPATPCRRSAGPGC